MQGRVGVHTKLKTTVADIESKYKDILLLEQNVNELFELFQELSTLIQAQGEQLDNIESNMDDAIDYVEKAEVHLRNATEIHQKTRGKMCCVLLYVGLVLGYLMAWLFGYI